MGLFLSQRWRRQPRGLVDIDWSHPLAHRLIYSQVPGSARRGFFRLSDPQITGSDFGIPAINGVFSYTAAAGASGFGFRGRSFLTNKVGTSFGSLTLKSSFAGGNPVYTYAGLFERPVLDEAQTSIATFAINAGSALTTVNQGSGGSDTTFSTRFVDAEPRSQEYSASVNDLIVDKRLNVAITVYENNQVPIGVFNNRQLSFSNSTVFDGASTAFSSNYINVSGVYIGLAVFFWARKLSAAETASFSENPWQLFRPPRATFFSLGQSFQFSRPTTDTLTGWTRVPTGGTHSSAINEVTSNQSDYLSAASAGLVDSFTMGQLQQPSDGALQINYDIDASVRGTKIELLNGASVVKTATISVASAGRFLPQRWRKQPQRPVEIDWRNPIARGLRMCISPATNPLREIASGHDYTWTGLDLGFTATPNGRAFAKYLNGAAYQNVLVDDPLAADSFVMAGSGGEFTCAIVTGFIPSEINRPDVNLNQIVSVDLASQTGGFYSFNLNTYSLDSANTFRIETRSFDGIDADAYAISNQTAIAPRRGQNVFFSSIDTLTGFYVNSIGSAVQANSSLNGQSGLPSSNWSVISVSSNNNMNVAVATMVLWWTRYLSSAEKSSMQDNPWQIFRPAIPRFFSLPAPTGTIEVSSAELSSVSWPWTPTIRITSQ